MTILNCFVVTKESKGLDDEPLTLYWDFLTWEFRVLNDRALTQVTLDRRQIERAVAAGGTLRRFGLQGPLPD